MEPSIAALTGASLRLVINGVRVVEMVEQEIGWPTLIFCGKGGTTNFVYGLFKDRNLVNADHNRIGHGVVSGREALTRTSECQRSLEKFMVAECTVSAAQH